MAAAATAVTMGLLLLPVSSLSRGAPDSFANLASKLSPAVVNISTTQVLKGDKKGQPEFMVPRGSPFEEFFKEYLERNRPKNRGRRRATSLGSGFIIDKSGLVVTNNQVIAPIGWHASEGQVGGEGRQNRFGSFKGGAQEGATVLELG